MTNPTDSTTTAPLAPGDRVEIVTPFIEGQTGHGPFGTGTVIGLNGYVQPVQVLVDDPDDPTMQLEFAVADLRKVEAVR